jgi:hypothetical protein
MPVGGAENRNPVLTARGNGGADKSGIYHLNINKEIQTKQFY